MGLFGASCGRCGENPTRIPPGPYFYVLIIQHSLTQKIFSIMTAAYKSNFFAFMSFLDGMTYSPQDDITFSQERILEITDLDVANFLTFKAYGPNLFPEEGPDEFPVALTRASTLAFYKKAISSYMTRQRQQWDEITGQGNPTKSAAVNEIIKALKKREVRGDAVPSSARRAIDWNEFMCLLVGTRLVYPMHDVQYIMLAVLTLQWQIIGRIDDVMQLVTTTIQDSEHFDVPVHFAGKDVLVEKYRDGESIAYTILVCFDGSACLPPLESRCVF